MIFIYQRLLSNYKHDLFLHIHETVDDIFHFHFRSPTESKVMEPECIKFPYKKFRNWLPDYFSRMGYALNLLIPLDLLLKKKKPRFVILEGESNILTDILLFPVLKIRRIPYVWWSLGSLPNKKLSWKRKVLNPILKIIYKNARHISTYSSHGKEFYISQGIPPDRIHIAQNALSEKFVKQNYSRCLTISKDIVQSLEWENKLRLTYIGAFTRKKRPDLLIHAVNGAKKIIGENLSIFFVGDGPLRMNCEELCHNYSIDAHFTGRVFDTASGYILASHTVIIPGLGGLAINHAMMLGRTVICGPADGTEKDLIINGVTGYYLEEVTVDSLKDAIIKIYHEKDKLLEMGVNAKNHVNEIATIYTQVNGLIGDIIPIHRGEK